MKRIEDVQFPGEMNLSVQSSDLDFDQVQHAATEFAKKYDSDPMLLAWYNRKTDEHFPKTTCEGEDTDPGWVDYAKSHGGNLTVNVNGGEFFYIFKTKQEFVPPGHG